MNAHAAKISGVRAFRFFLCKKGKMSSNFPPFPDHLLATKPASLRS